MAIMILLIFSVVALGAGLNIYLLAWALSRIGVESSNKQKSNSQHF